MPHRILLIENQFTQFKELYRKLRDKYDIFPKLLTDMNDPSEFKKILDPVRVFLNGRYNDYNQDIAKNKIADYVNDLNPELVVVDYKLVGHHFAKNGIDLAFFIKENELMKDKERPILFLSRTQASANEVLSRIGEIRQPQQWLYKGYNGARIFSDEFIENEVFSAIDNLVSSSKIEKVKLSLTLILDYVVTVAPELEEYKLLSKRKGDPVMGKLDYDEVAKIQNMLPLLQQASQAQMEELLNSILMLFNKYEPHE